jgi:hypothetical protein
MELPGNAGVTDMCYDDFYTYFHFSKEKVNFMTVKYLVRAAK